ncbi:hypothetical protein ARMSODRAFT_956963 [Armillaria solidipes]|uniref:Uncharacterized protein n=1 Tax=Armillaria solidipes TaxID=1076256 RepID=A0A2H3BZP0_9AGAR|nr:hypothetical protein ARMSODRAFT_956963 [Armillaria solidipes]
MSCWQADGPNRRQTEAPRKADWSRDVWVTKVNPPQTPSPPCSPKIDAACWRSLTAQWREPQNELKGRDIDGMLEGEANEIFRLHLKNRTARHGASTSRKDLALLALPTMICWRKIRPQCARRGTAVAEYKRTRIRAKDGPRRQSVEEPRSKWILLNPNQTGPQVHRHIASTTLHPTCLRTSC